MRYYAFCHLKQWHIVAFWLWLNRALCAAIVIALALLLTGCATQGDYWKPVRPQWPVKEVRIVEAPCGTLAYGCARLTEGIIEIRRGLSVGFTECVRTHEMKHFAGYDHRVGTHYSTDCGDGTQWVQR